MLDAGLRESEKVTVSGRIEAPCTEACPAGVDVPRYIRFLSEGKFGDALAVNLEKIPFPWICGYVCHHPCESKCARIQYDEAIAIRALKRAAADRARDSRSWRAGKAQATGKSVAVVGSGPAGLTAAYYLAKSGHQVTVFEALPRAGGMMRLGIPKFELPTEVLEREIEEIKALGVDIRTDSRVESLEWLFQEGYQAVFVATGAHREPQLGIEGEDGPGVMNGVSFLAAVASGGQVSVGDSVVVIGGGNTAVDAARTARRLGAEVRMICLESRREMPAFPWEVGKALEEGITLACSEGPKKILRDDGRVVGVVLKECASVFDSQGRFHPVFREDKVRVVPATAVIRAIGQVPEIPPGFALAADEKRRVRPDPTTLATERPGVFAGGDVVLGPASIVDAIAHGRRVAISIDRYLGGNGRIDETLASAEEAVRLPKVVPKGKARPEMPRLPLPERLAGFAAVELGFPDEVAVEEARRCLGCDVRRFQVEVDAEACKACGYCMEVCGLGVFSRAGSFNRRGYRPVRVVMTERCVGCMRCFYVCPDFAIEIKEGAEVATS
jgi:NADPH-dependent glutamate synthase beta subunit-like oxidoreductase